MADPILIGISPTSGPAGTAVTLTGTGLAAITTVSLNGLACPLSNQSDTALIVVVPPGAAAGSFAFGVEWTGTVVQPGGFVLTPGGSPPPSPGGSNDLVLAAGLGGAVLLAVLLLKRGAPA